MSWLTLWTGYLICSVAHSARVANDECNLPPELVAEIHNYKDLVENITAEVTSGSYAGVFYKELASFVYKFGYRKSGTQALEMSIVHLSNVLSDKGLVTKLEHVALPLWLRGKEMAYYITSFRKKRLRIKALGGSPSGNLTAPLIVVKDVNELEIRANEVTGKIVLFNTEFTDYETSVLSRNEGPARASYFGAVGALVRSVTPFSIGSIHVGVTNFDGAQPIPAAAISLEDADVLSELVKIENTQIELLIANREELQENLSNNLIIDIPGKSEPQSYMMLSGHIDSWDVGQGALDDGGGAFLAFQSLLLLNHMNIPPPRRTLRAILWTGEEMGLYGAKAYAEAHAEEIKNWTAAFESDEGLFEPLGFKLKGNEEAACIVKEILSMFPPLNATEVERTNKNIMSDISVFNKFNVPLMAPLMKPNNYFWFHHTEGDSMRVMNSTLLDRHLALITGTAYVLADLSKSLPREETRRSAPTAGPKKLRKSHLRRR